MTRSSLAYRDHGHALARGMDPGACMAEMFGKTTGCAKGKGGSMHMFDRPHWLFGGHGIVGRPDGRLARGWRSRRATKWEVMKKATTRPDGMPAGPNENIPAKKKVSALLPRRRRAQPGRACTRQ